MHFFSLAAGAAILVGTVSTDGVDASSASSSGTSLCDAPSIEAEVTIVGGGLAGIFAALVLEQAGVSYSLLESSGTWGGRLRSFTAPSSFGGLTLEEGAQYMYGKSRSRSRVNPIWKLFDSFGMDVFDYTLHDMTAYRKRTGQKVEDFRLQKLIGKIEKTVRNCLDVAGEEWHEDWINGVETEDVSAQTTLEECSPGDWVNTTPLRTALANIFAGHQENMVRLDEVSKAAFPDDSVYHYGRELFVQYGPEGTTSIMEALVAKLPGDSVYLNAKVTSVEDFDSGASHVKTIAEMGECDQEFLSDYIILTVPLSILKGASSSNVISFDSPLQHLDDHPIELNKVEKVWIKFSESFWDDSSQWIVITNNLKGGASTNFFNYNKIFPGCNILQTFVDEQQQKDMGGTGVIDVDTVFQDLKKLPDWHGGITYESVVTGWQNDPNFVGAWEIWKLGKTIGDFQKFTLPQGNLHKAGSGVCYNLWGFTWAAVLSGVAQAEWVVGRIDSPGSAVEDLEPWSPCSELGDIDNKNYKAFYKKYGALFEPSS